ncbi:hypothetical protein JR316_0012944 [Psilocybe cubensis]|uniref:Uncharacterized protein n=2 Tax=Psilocybe cubensis TaxID=181762 RepID=A0ACB8GHE2_PSICU|nr:hypothetical protein JR316_0012944 [Psilocybe cubensis]KAH9474485.1 hypothetical protein JR316_0012944 [Psilocybe cubensis]
MDKRPPLHLGHTNRFSLLRALVASLLVVVATISSLGLTFGWKPLHSTKVPLNAAQIVQKCQTLHMLPAPPANFHQRERSDRYVAGTPPTLLRNASIWTGRDSGNEVVTGDILLDNGLIKQIGKIKDTSLKAYSNLIIIDAGGSWITPGIVDLHSHLGVSSAPSLKGSNDGNSHKGPILPWLRSLDGLNTHDEAYRLSVSGGVTTANVLPGSANAIGGQAFTIKLRPTSERSSSAMVLEPPFELNGTNTNSSPPRWRQMKYNTARKIKEKQDEFCAKALDGQWKDLGNFPEDLQWEALVDVLRGRVKIHNHCYEGVDLDGIVRLTNEFKFSIAAFHHAHETYLVPDLLKKAYGHPPAIAMFATNARYKREAYRGSEFAARILADNGLQVVMKSDHPVLDSRYLLHEAQQAHYFGLPPNLALASVTSTPATVLGYDHRIGYIKPGYDADIVIWDSHPLAIGATPVQVFIDGIAQLNNPHVNKKPDFLQRIPKTPDFSKEAKDAVEYDGLPPLETDHAKASTVLFTNVDVVLLKDGSELRQVFTSAVDGPLGVVLVEHGKIVCFGLSRDCPSSLREGVQIIDLEGGSISPALISFGSRLALNHIDGEASTNDGAVHDPLVSDAPSILGKGSVIRAVDGLQFGTRDALLAYRSGVTLGVTAPTSSGLISGLGTAFNTGSPHKLATGAVLQEETALHVSVGSSAISVSTQIGVLRSLLHGEGKGNLGASFSRVIEGQIPLVIQVNNADIMASLIDLKREVETSSGKSIQMTFAGAEEAHLVAKEISEAGIGVILRPSRSFPKQWQSRRILPGPPLTMDNSISVLRRNNVTVAIGVVEQWSSRNIRFDLAWAALDSGLSFREAIALASTNLERLLGVTSHDSDLVAVRGKTILDFEGKVAGIISPGRGVVDLI